jgi:glucarate dehydratase
MNPTASLYNVRMQLHAAIEFACLDIIGQKLGVPVFQLLGGKLRDEVAFASYLFFRYPNENGQSEVRTVEQLLQHARLLKTQYGFQTHKLKGGVFPPEYELEAYQALAHEFPRDRVRYDPNAALSVEDALWFGRQIVDLHNDYYEDPTWGLNGLRQIRARLPGLLLATNTVVTNFEQLATNMRDPSVDVILLDTTFWGGVRSCLKAAAVCETFQIPVSIHSSGELGIQLASMLHLGAVLPNLTFAADAHYHHLLDDVIAGGKFPYRNGCIEIPNGPGLGIQLDQDKVGYYHELFLKLGAYPYDRDPYRPNWYALVPNTRWANPDISAEALD